MWKNTFMGIFHGSVFICAGKILSWVFFFFICAGKILSWEKYFHGYFSTCLGNSHGSPMKVTCTYENTHMKKTHKRDLHMQKVTSERVPQK